MIHRSVSALLIGLITFDASALDNEIRVLAVITAGAVNDDNISLQLNQIEIVWNNSSVPTSNTMELVNSKDGSGNPIKPVLTGPPVVTTTFESTHALLLTPAYNLTALRDTYQADLVIAYVQSSAVQPGVCGFAPMRNWTDAGGTPGIFIPSFTPPLLGLDVRGRENYFLAIMSTSANCLQIQLNNNNLNNAAHEVAHLFGAGHDTEATPYPLEPAPPPGFYLFTDSHAYVYTITYYGYTFVYKTVLSRTDPFIQSCLSNSFGYCFVPPLFSTEGGVGDGDHDNVKTLAFTANSIANYRPIPPPCGLAKPTNVSGFVVDICWLSTNLTQHYVSWFDSCPAATDYYNVKGSTTGPFGPWPVTAATTDQFIDVWNNIPAWIRVDACDSSTCLESNTFYFAEALCDFN